VCIGQNGKMMAQSLKLTENPAEQDRFFLSVFLSWVANTQINHWTKPP